MSEARNIDAWMQGLREAGAARLDSVGWHYIEVLAQRTQAQTGPAQALLYRKLQPMLEAFAQRLTQEQAQAHAPLACAEPAAPSALAVLLQEMAPSGLDLPPSTTTSTFGMHRESPRVRQFRKQLRQISVQKRVSKAIARAPQNAGPINSHMLVLRALGLMRDISPDYLNRFMTHVDTLLCLEEADRLRTAPKKTAGGKKTRADSIGQQ
jgi:hypothetical protein